MLKQLWKNWHRFGFAALWCCLLLAGTALPGSAQGLYDSIAYLSDGELWVWSVGEDYPIQMTGFADDAFIYVIEMSPDGRYVAAGVRISIVDASGLLVDDYSEVWLYDIPSAALSKITPDHPLPDENGYVGGEEYGAPTFSPDGSELAWVYYYEQFGGSVYGVDFYTIATQETRRVPGGIELGYQDGGLSLPRPQWGAGGLLDVVATIGSDNQFHNVVTRYDPVEQTGTYYDIWRQDMGDDQLPTDVQWAERAGRHVIAYRRAEIWHTLDPLDGTETSYSGAPTIHLAGYTLAANTLRTPSGEPVMLPEGARILTVSTGGGAVLFRAAESAGVWEAGSTRLFDPPLDIRASIGALAGARRVLRFDNVEPTGTTSFAFSVRTDITPCFLPPRLQIGQTAVVVPGAGANLLRADAGLAAAAVGSIPEGAQMTVLDGAVCRDGYRWWQVDYNGLVGWTAEGDPVTGEYWLTAVP